MAEHVQTGGLMQFNYNAQELSNQNLSDKEKKDIAEAYEKYDERKKKEKRKRIIFGVILVLIILIGLFFIVKRYF